MKPVKNNKVGLVSGGHYWTKDSNDFRLIRNVELVVDSVYKRGDRSYVNYHYPSVCDTFCREYDEVLRGLKI